MIAIAIMYTLIQFFFITCRRPCNSPLLPIYPHNIHSSREYGCQVIMIMIMMIMTIMIMIMMIMMCQMMIMMTIMIMTH